MNKSIIKSTEINTDHIKALFHAEDKTKKATYVTMREFWNEYLAQGYSSPSYFVLPRDWFFETLQKKRGTSDKEIELIRTKLEELDNSPRGEEK